MGFGALVVSRGKSSSIKTSFFSAKSANSFLLKTFFLSALHGGHQVDPVKSIRMALSSFWACSFTALKSLSHFGSACRLETKVTSTSNDKSFRIGSSLDVNLPYSFDSRHTIFPATIVARALPRIGQPW